MQILSCELPLRVPPSLLDVLSLHQRPSLAREVLSSAVASCLAQDRDDKASSLHQPHRVSLLLVSWPALADSFGVQLVRRRDQRGQPHPIESPRTRLAPLPRSSDQSEGTAQGRQGLADSGHFDRQVQAAEPLLSALTCLLRGPRDVSFSAGHNR